MHRIEEFVDERLKGWCIHCGGWLQESETNVDHVPSQSLLRKPHPHHLPKVTVCSACNSGFSLDEQYLVAFLGSVLTGSTEPERQTHEPAKRALKRSAKLRERIEGSKTSYQTLGGETRQVWKPEIRRINRIVIKNARGHAYFEYGDPMLTEPMHVWTLPIASLAKDELVDFEGIESQPEDGGIKLSAWPEVGSRMMTRVITGQDLLGDWVIVQDGVYRYSVSQFGVMRVRSVIHEYLATEVLWDK